MNKIIQREKCHDLAISSLLFLVIVAGDLTMVAGPLRGDDEMICLTCCGAASMSDPLSSSSLTASA